MTQSHSEELQGEEERKRSLVPFVLMLVIFVLAALSAMFGSLSPTPQNAVSFLSTLSQVSITLVAIILALVVYLARYTDLLTQSPTSRRIIILSGMLFFGTVVVALVNIALMPGYSEGLPPLEVASKILTPGLLFAVGAILLYYAVEDILQKLPE